GLDPYLIIALGLFLLTIVPASLLARRSGSSPAAVPDARSRRLGLSGAYHDRRLGREVPYQAADTNSALGVMFGAGLVAGMFGIGSGVLKVLALDRALKLPIKVSTSTSNFMMGVTAAAGAGVLLAAGYLNPVIAAPVAVGTTLGAFAGSRLLPGLSNVAVRYIFLILIAFLAVELILRGLGIS
ncbi:MAG: sulfite exporter TauE/SafE family protein, partial [Thermoplasmata archaeon]